MYTLRQEQILNISAEELWQFISHPANLNTITPPELDFTIISDIPDKMYNGLLVEYDVKLPLLGHSEWVTEIKHIVPGKEFVDEQRIGPYRFWYHHHKIEEMESGVRMIDEVNYVPPYGILGRIVNKLLIRNKLRDIFEYRKQVLNKRYNEN
ncbi:SRPBCC family protein [Fodinibius sp.]|uniref:SRPBCC family protein n=1 Tax=Fodinibius sp. TaxID=1872440 RepID=UPI002ACD4C8E|nr:SRPBCC family protein [Fodinibius sp.]MDZ7659840.1 SRPBCC family protein [Fodinibius sp.]